MCKRQERGKQRNILINKQLWHRPKVPLTLPSRETVTVTTSFNQRRFMWRCLSFLSCFLHIQIKPKHVLWAFISSSPAHLWPDLWAWPQPDPFVCLRYLFPSHHALGFNLTAVSSSETDVVKCGQRVSDYCPNLVSSWSVSVVVTGNIHLPLTSLF